MTRYLTYSLVLLAWLTMGLSTAEAQVGRNISKYNLTSAAVGIKGFDPVAIFPEGGARAVKGNPDISSTYEGVTYYFSTAENLALFSKNPTKYESTYGGWCAYAMSYGSYVDIDPTVYTLNGNRAHYFISKRAKANFDSKITESEPKADRNWKNLTGEEPRL